MKVFYVEFDVNKFQYLRPAAAKVDLKDYIYDCSPRADGWTPSEVYVPNPARRRPDIWCIANGSALAISSSKIEPIRTQLEMAGELLPLPFGGEEFSLLNVTECVNCLDPKRSKWTSDDEDRMLHAPNIPGSHVFDPTRFHESSIFKIPETRQSYFYCWEREQDREVEFKAGVEAARLKGLNFKLIWEDQS